MKIKFYNWNYNIAEKLNNWKINKNSFGKNNYN